MPELLLEVGCEELPASFVARANHDLSQALEASLRDAGLEPVGLRTACTPRRLIVGFSNVIERQADSVKEVRGPAAKAAFDDQGTPSNALLGFCRGQGVDPSTARVEGEYVFVTKAIPGRPSAEVLAELIPAAIRSLAFDKTMRWGSSRLRFARPIRWIVASLGGEVVPFSVEMVTSGQESRGHRFNFPDSFVVSTFEQLVAELRSREVECDSEARIRRVREGAIAVSGDLAELSDALVEENAFLTEWPMALLGEFDPLYLELPDPVLVTVMAKHERFFPVRGKDGKLTNQFVSIRNGGVDHAVRQGNAWVLNARANDAKFFFDDDLRYSLNDFLSKTEGIVFQAELGTVRQRADRLATLAANIALTNQTEADWARLAGLYAKADLSCGLVSELPALQGVIGGIYAAREGLPDPICWAIRDQYDPTLNPLPVDPNARTAIRLILADQLDKLAGYLGLGLTPSGSSDPYGLRRAAGTAMELGIAWPEANLEFDKLLRSALAGYAREFDGDKVLASAAEVFRQRYSTIFPTVPADVLDAVLSSEQSLAFAPHRVKQRIEWVQRLAVNASFVQAATRPLNIVAAAEKKGISIPALQPQDLDSAEGLSLWHAVQAVQTVDADSLRGLELPINAFFDSTMVMVDDERIRGARLALLKETGRLLLQAGDFSKLVVPG